MHALFHGTSVIPVVTIERMADAVPLARALPRVVVGAGTVQRPADVAQAATAGARFLVSPGMTAELASAALASDLPYLPGVATPSEIMAARDLGLCFLKLFPAEALGGVALLRALATVFPGVAFCPTGGIEERSARDYLALPNVPIVGGSWMAPRDAVAAGDWAVIRRLAERAGAIGRHPASPGVAAMR